MLILWCRTDIGNCTFSAKVSLILDNLFLVPSLCKLNHISLCFIQINTKSPATAYPFRESNVFLKPSRCFGPLGKFQRNIKISIKTARVSRQPLSCDYGYVKFLNILSYINVTKKRLYKKYKEQSFLGKNIRNLFTGKFWGWDRKV